MAAADVMLLIDVLKLRGVKRLTLTGGEPMQLGRERLFPIIRYASESHLHTCLSTTGLGLTEADTAVLSGCLDQILLSLHSVTDATDLRMFRNSADGARMREQVENLLAWLSDTPVKIQVTTVTSRVNAEEIVAIGRWLFSRSSKVTWRLEEFYANGIRRDSSRAKFELSDEAFADIANRVESDPVLTGFFGGGRITTSSKSSRALAPDVMLTPQGNLVTSSSHAYECVGDLTALPNWDFKNRRPWSDYRRTVRDDWDWLK